MVELILGLLGHIDADRFLYLIGDREDAIFFQMAIAIFDEDRDRDRDLNFGNRSHALQNGKSSVKR